MYKQSLWEGGLPASSALGGDQPPGVAVQEKSSFMLIRVVDFTVQGLTRGEGASGFIPSCAGIPIGRCTAGLVESLVFKPFRT